MANKQQQLRLHDLLKEDQEPFQLNSYIADRRSQFQKPSPTTTIQLKNRRPIISDTTLKRGSFCRRACFLSFANSPDVRKSPFLNYHSPAAMSPCKSPNAAVFHHVPSKIAAHLAEAAIRIQKQEQSKTKLPSKSVGFGLFGSFLKRLKDRSKSKKRVIGDDELRVSRKQGKDEGNFRISNAEKSVDLNEASTSSCCSEETNCGLELWETRFCTSPFKFSVHQSPLSTGRRTPDFCSPMASPCRVAKQGKENVEIQDSDNVQGEEETDKEQCSPVSVLDPPFEDDDEHQSGDAEEESCDLECSYANVQRAKEQLLYRLRRFEKLAELDPIELERKLLEGSDSESQCEFEESENDETLFMYTNHSIYTFVSEAFDQLNNQNHSVKRSTDMNRTVSDQTVEEKNDVICLGNKEVILGRICKRLDFSKEVKFATIDMMIELDLKSEFDGWKKFSEQREDTVAEIEFAIFGVLMEELSEDLSYMDEHNQELDYVHIGCT